ncbi:hypothetical protein CLOACE_16290 [Clostridium acetireducens DSM 10703]|jgi:hypothetical protein|uniref:Uncharacterized protein n=1 Tax=Clostridium acetireducens DSM 10703 TaxID=1121290 RepID=A0A1E8EXN0_9CLOT|nr:hypothetical protein [Clostridium acetireducens]OFI05546.1 hypothetical protein CLOACE_16290 [Clostridium acetireducens DSM 10703]
MENLNLKETLEKVKSWAKEVGAMQAEKIEEEAGGNVITYEMKKANGTMGINVIAGNEKIVKF